MKDIRDIIESAWENRDLLKEQNTIDTIRKVVDLLVDHSEEYATIPTPEIRGL